MLPIEGNGKLEDIKSAASRLLGHAGMTKDPEMQKLLMGGATILCWLSHTLPVFRPDATLDELTQYKALHNYMVMLATTEGLGPFATLQDDTDTPHAPLPEDSATSPT